MASNAEPANWRCPDWITRLGFTFAFAALGLLVFRGLLTNSVSRWTTEPQYSHGFVIPLIAVWLGWYRRDRIPGGDARCCETGLILIALGVVSHLFAAWFYIEAIDGVGLILFIAGTVLLIWGRRFFVGIWPAVFFLTFMLPLPFQVEKLLSAPLQLMGANESAWFIQAFGIPAIAQGNTILMGETRLGVAEACSGLRMLMVFIAISAAAVIVSRRTRWEKILILFSAIPIALICNILRIVATAVAHHSVGQETADLIFHDLSGWLMMPLAMLLLSLELWLIDCLFVEAVEARPSIMTSRIPNTFSVMPEQPR